MTISAMNGIVESVQRKTKYIFSESEKSGVLDFTRRKCEINGKGEDYIPLLFENELRDYVSRKKINEIGRFNLEMKMAMEEPMEVLVGV